MKERVSEKIRDRDVTDARRQRRLLCLPQPDKEIGVSSIIPLRHIHPFYAEAIYFSTRLHKCLKTNQTPSDECLYGSVSVRFLLLHSNFRCNLINIYHDNS